MGIDVATLESMEPSAVLLAMGLIVAALVLLPPAARRKVISSVVWLLLFALAWSVRRYGAAAKINLDSFAYVGLFFLLCSIGRSVFLIIVRSRFTHWMVLRAPRIMLDVAQAFVYVVALLITLRAVGVEPSSLVASSAVVGAALGFLMKDTLGNIFSGLAIQTEYPFEIGDWIQFDPDKSRIGKVLEINWRATKVLTLDDVVIVVPNGLLAQTAIINYTKPETYSRRSIYVVAPYNVPPQKVQRIILDALANMVDLVKQPPTSVVTFNFTERGVEYWVRIFTTKFHQRDRVDGEARDRIWYAFQRHGITIPGVQHRVGMEQLTVRGAQQKRQRGQRARRRALATVDFLQVLPEDALDKLARRAKRRFYAAGEELICEGAEGTEFFVLTSGQVAVTKKAANGDSIEVTRLQAPAFFGEMSLLTGEKRTATVLAAGSTSCLVIDKRALAKLLASHPYLAETISAALPQRRAMQEEKLRAAAGVAGDFNGDTSDLVKSIRSFFGLAKG